MTLIQKAQLSNMKRISWVLTFLCFALALCGYAQEEEGYLLFNYDQIERSKLERNHAPRERVNTTLELPFFDDFSRFSLPTSDPDVPVEWQRWEDASVYVNDHFPIEPPTIGVATFDGLNGNGYPYNFNAPDAWGPADTLTSCPIDLGSFSAEDDVYLTFFFQPEGRGNFPDENDTFHLEFYRASDGVWIETWSVGGSELLSFEQVFVPIWNDSLQVDFFDDEFQFRFRNYSTLSGNMDHWHLDYVYMDAGINPETLDFNELAIMDPEVTMLQDYTAMPWEHFISNPASFMKVDNEILLERVLGSTPINFESGFRVEYEGTVWDNPNSFVNTNGLGIIETTIESSDFVFDDSVNDTCAVFNVKHYHEIADGTQQNDTTSFDQIFTNYYAYDDGSAERAYALNVPGSRLAMRFRSEEPDSLIGLFVHFTPFRNNNEDELFILRARGDGGGEPGDELAENYAFQSPNYYNDGYNKFAYYEYDNPMAVDGAFYVGWSQDSDVHLNVGNDKNTNENPENLFYQLGIANPWTQSTISGSLMIRPVLQAGKTNVWNSISELNESEFSLYPNPTTDVLNIYPVNLTREYDLSLFDLSGREVKRQNSQMGQTRFVVSDLPSGAYLVEVSHEGLLPKRHQFIKQ